MSRNQFGIVISEKEPLWNGALKLVDECSSQGISTEIIKIENIRHKIPEVLPVCLYPLCNSDDLNTFIPLLMRRGHDVVNGMYYQQRFDKMSMQACLQLMGVPVPEFYSMKLVSKIRSLMESGTRFLAKPNCHISKQEILSRNDTLARFQDSITIRGEYYAEKLINAEDEYKLYVVGEEVFFDHNKLDNRMDEIMQIVASIRVVSKFEVFSMDVLQEVKTCHLFVIDVNPAPAFYMTADARAQFVQYINNKLTRLGALKKRGCQ